MSELPRVMGLRELVDIPSWDRWFELEESLRERNRHFIQNGSFFASLIDSCRSHATEMPTGETYFRARILSPLQEQTLGSSAPLPLTEHKAPKPDHVQGSRLNPEGIPYLYVASDLETAIAEVRPWKGAQVSVGAIRLVRPVTVVDARGRAIRKGEGERELRDPMQPFAYVLGRPVHEHDRLRYVATQYISEALKAEGFDGLWYDSSLNPAGSNLALFDENVATVTSASRHRVRGVRYDVSDFAAR